MLFKYMAVGPCRTCNSRLRTRPWKSVITAHSVKSAYRNWSPDPCSILEGHTVNHPAIPASVCFWCLVPTLPLCFVSGMSILKASSGNTFPASWQTRNQRRKAESVVIKPSKAYLPSTWDILLLAKLHLIMATQSPKVRPQDDGQDCGLVRF